MKEVIKYSFEVLFVIVVSIISYNFWDYKDLTKEITYAKYYSGNFENKYETKNLTYNFNSKLEYENLIPATYDSFDRSNIKYMMISNNNINPIKYKMIIKLDKNSTSDIRSVVLVLNDSIIKLSDGVYTENKNNYLIETNDYIIKDNSIYRIMAYLDNSLNDDIKPSSLHMNIELVEL